MGWHESYLAQACSDLAVLDRLDDPDVEYCHRLHYLLMVSEKLAKAMLTPSGSTEPAPMTHVILVRMLQTLKGRPEIRRGLGFKDPVFFRAYIDSMLDFAGRLEQLSPEQAGYTQPNPEYPWRDQASGEVHAPSQFAFREFDPRNPKMAKIDQLLRGLIRVMS